MKAFDSIIGYDAIKNELIQICNMVQKPALTNKAS